MATRKAAAKKTRTQKPFTIGIRAKSNGNFTWEYYSKGKLMMQSGEMYLSATAAKNAAKSMITLIKKQDTAVIAFETM